MNKELIIDSSSSDTVIALLEEKKLVELHREKVNNSFAVGDIFLGRINKVMQGLNAAFVHIGYEKNAFLHYLDLGPQFASLNKYVNEVKAGKHSTYQLSHLKLEPDIDKRGKITKLLSQNQNIVVQIAKEPISNKGPRLTSDISIAGRYLVLLPFSDKISISQKIKNNEERERLKRLIQSIKPKNFGVIIRTVAEKKKVVDLDTDLKDLIKKWEESCRVLQRARPPKKILGELDRTSAIMRDLLNTTFSNIYIDNVKLFDEIKSYLKTIAPEHEKIVKLYKGKTPIFDYFGINKQIKASFGKYVTTTGGIYLVIEHTEALHAIDVNSGNKSRSGDDQEASALDVNLSAAEEVARQLRLRDMGGIIVVDFIDMRKAENRKALYDKMKKEMDTDRARHNILPPSRFGLVQITRHRVRPVMAINTAEECPACKGSGEIQPSILLVDEIESNIDYILKEIRPARLTLCVHPFVESHLTKGVQSIQRKWSFKYRKWIKINKKTSYHFLEYRFFNEEEKEIVI